MAQKNNFVSLDTIFSKINRDLRGSNIEESDIIEWAGEALGFMKVKNLNEEAVAFVEVKNHRADMPEGLKFIIQIARNNTWTGDNSQFCPKVILDKLSQDNTVNPNESPMEGVPIDEETGLPDDTDIAYYRPYFDLQYEYQGWANTAYYKESYTPVRLSNQSFFKTLVAQETNPHIQDIYRSCTSDEYTIIGNYPNNGLLFSFQEGFVAIAYIRPMVDSATGYPLVPDDSSCINAISYYIKWKMAERNRWNGVDGANTEAQEAERLWLKYIRQAINSQKMPNSIDEYQNLMEQSLYLIPRTRMYYGYFGNLGREENRRFNNPDGRRRFTYNRYNYGYF